MSTSKYDVSAIRRNLINRISSGRDVSMSLSDEAGGENEAVEESYTYRQAEFFESLAKSLFALIEERYPGSCEHGDSWDLLDDEYYASGSCDRPPLSTPINEAFVRLRVEEYKAIWIIFTRDGIEVCETNEREGVWFPKSPFKIIGYEDPRIFSDLERTLAQIGFPIPGLADHLGG